jgi:hypothetical protein
LLQGSTALEPPLELPPAPAELPVLVEPAVGVPPKFEPLLLVELLPPEEPAAVLLLPADPAALPLLLFVLDPPLPPERPPPLDDAAVVPPLDLVELLLEEEFPPVPVPVVPLPPRQPRPTTPHRIQVSAAVVRMGEFQHTTNAQDSALSEKRQATGGRATDRASPR